MTKKRNWLCFIKKLFFQDAHSHQQHKCKRRRWLFGRLKRTTKGLPSPNAEAVKSTVPPVTDVVKTTDFEERLSKSDEVVRKSIRVCENEVPMCRDIVTDDASIFSFSAMLKSHVQHQAATRIQTAYRGHLARKALRAIKGFVTLQAIIRGRAVRRQAANTLKCLQSIVSIQSEICARRSLMSRGKSRDLVSQDVRNEKPKTTKIPLSRDRRSDCGLPTKYEETDTILRKKEPTLRSQRIKSNSFNHRKSTDSEEEVTNGRLKYWLKQYVGDQLRINGEKIREKQPKVRSTDGFHHYDNISGPRRSLQNHRKQTSCTEDGLHPSSPSNLPPYMAATKSAKAKTRSLSSPRLRPMHFDAYSDGDSPYKHKLSPMSSVNSEVTGSSFSKVSHKSFYSSSQQKSPGLKGVSGPVRSNKTIDDIRLDSERLVLSKG